MSDIPDGAAAGPWSDGFHAAEAIYQKDIDRLEAENARLRAAVLEFIPLLPGYPDVIGRRMGPKIHYKALALEAIARVDPGRAEDE